MPFSPEGCIPLPGPKPKSSFPKDGEIFGDQFVQYKYKCPHITNPETPHKDCIPDEPETLKIETDVVVTAVGPMGPCPDDCDQGPLGNEVFDNIPDVIEA